MPRKNLVNDLFAEVINYGGIAATRWQAYQHAYRAVLSRCENDGAPDPKRTAALCADMFAFGPRVPALSPEEAAGRIPWETAIANGLVGGEAGC